MSEFLDMAIELAFKNVREGGSPYGSVVVKDNVVIGKGVNTTHKDPNVAGHAEILAIQEAQARLNQIDLSDCIIYASGQPCPMCLGAIALSGIKEVVYANSVEDGEKITGAPSTSKKIYEYLGGDKDAIQLKLIHKPIKDDKNNPMITWYEKEEERF